MAITIITLHPRHVFRISRGAKAEVRNVTFQIDGEGFQGLGEASPNAFYNETAEDVAQRLAEISAWVSSLKITSPGEIIDLWPGLWKRTRPSRATACAVDLALWDWLAKMRDTTLSELLWNEKPHPIVSCVTLGLSEPGELASKSAELSGFPILKIKLSRDNPIELVGKIRQQTDARLVVDANAAWDANQLAEYAPQLARFGVEFIEQPLPPGQTFPRPILPVFADESCVVPEDIDQLHEGFSGFNLKLVKCGGITPALEMLERGKNRGLQSMTGCMLESSVLIAAGAAIAQRTDYADLDGSWLLESEPFGRVSFHQGVLTLND